MEDYLDIIQNGKWNYLSKIRDFLIIKTLRSTWMRISELLSVRFQDVAFDGSVKIIGKWKKIRTVFISNEIIERANFYRYVREESNLISDFIFVSHGRSSRWKRLSRNSVEEMIRKMNQKLWVRQKLTPHSFRHWFATEVVRKGGNLVDLQHALGHSNLATTSTYLHSDTKRIRELQELVQ
jgi:integrase/recombinase XerD